MNNNKIFGYARISTPQQSLERQIRNIKGAYPEAIVLTEAYTASTIDRPVFTKLRKQVKSGDTIVFDSISRMSRNSKEGMETYFDLYDRGINLVFLKEPHIDSAIYRKNISQDIEKTGTNADLILEGVNNYLHQLARDQIEVAFNQAEKELLDLRQRTKEGMETARNKGKQIGGVKGKGFETKKSKEAKEQIKKLSKAFGGNLTDKEIIKLLRIASNSYYKYKKELKKNF